MNRHRCSPAALSSLIILLCFWAAFKPPLARADQTKANNNNNLELGTSWVSGTAPGSGDNAIWDSTVLTPAYCTNTLGASVTWQGIVISNPITAVTINGSATLTMSGGINMSNATTNFNLNCSIVTLSANQTWNIATNLTLTTGTSSTVGRVQDATITKTGGGVWTTSGTDDNGSLGIIVNAGMVNLNKSSSSAHSVGGPGMTINGGVTRITGTGGDQIYNPANVTLTGGMLDFYGNAETFNTLYFNSGSVGNSTGNGTMQITSGIILGGSSCTFDIEGGNLTVPSVISGNFPLTKIGPATLVLSGTNTYSGSTTISAGELDGLTGGSCSNTAVTVNTGATNGVIFTGGNSQWSCGALTFSSGAYADFNFSNNPPSLAAPVIQVNGNLTFSGSLNIIVRGSIMPAGTYQLIKYTGALTGTPPGTALALPSGVTASLVNDTANNSIDLDVTTGNIATQVSWRVGNGVWDINTTSNWNNRADNPATYVDGDGVIFDDTATGSPPITVTLNTIVNPADIIANNSAKSYIISGSGAINGTNYLTVQGSGTLTLSGANTYTGGTILNSGQLNINNGGNSSSSAIGTGTLTITGGTIDNTSSSDVTLAPNNAQNWSGNFTYLGSANNLNLGTGTVSVTTNITLAISNNVLTTGGHVNNNYVTKTGNGTWTISGGSSTDNSGLGIVLSGGTINLNKSNSNSHCVGGGGLVINGGVARITGAGGDQIYDSASITFNGGLFDLYGHNETISYFAGTAGVIDNTAAGTMAVLSCTGNNSSAFFGTIQDSGIGATLGLTKAGTGSLILSGNNSFSGGTSISGGVLQLGSGNDTVPVITPLGAGPVTNNALISFASAQSVTMSNTIAGTGSISVDNGTAIFAADDTYAGSTTINTNNLLQLTGNASLTNSSSLIMASGAQLDVSELSNPWVWNARQTFTVTGPGATLVGDANVNSGQLTLSYSPDTPTLTVDDGVLTLSNNAVNVTVLGTTPLASGSYLIIAAGYDDFYGFDGELAGSISSSTLTVGGAGLASNTRATLELNPTGLYLDVASGSATVSTTLTVASSQNPSSYESPVVFTANIVPPPTNGETVTFLDGSTVLGTAALSGGSATFTYSNLWFGTHTIVASYDGDGQYQASAGSLSQVVLPFPQSQQVSANVSGGSTTVNFAGLPGYLYNVQRSTNLANPTGWTTIAVSIHAASDGSIQFTDPNPPQPNAFYRLCFDPEHGTVPVADTTLQPVVMDNLPVIAYITACDVNEQTVTNALPAAEQPLYYPYNSWTSTGNSIIETAANDAWWDNLVAEQLQAHVPVVLLNDTGCWTTNAADLTSPGNLNPRRLKYWWDAVQRAGATNSFKSACFAEAAAQGIYDNYYGLPSSDLYDFANTDAWNQVWWLRIIKPFYDTVPSNSWYYINGRVPIECWGLNITTIWTNQQGNISKMFDFLTSKMQSTYGVTPCFIMGTPGCDTTLATDTNFVGDNEWFGPPSTAYTMTPYKGYVWGGVVAGYIDPGYYTPGNSHYGNANSVLVRTGISSLDVSGANGDTLIDGLSAAVNTNALFTMIEGYTDVSESTGPVRSLSTNWDYPNQYLDILRSYTDLRTTTLRLEAEGCDEYANATGNPGGVYRRTGTLGIRALPGSGWAVTGTVAGEWIQFTNLQFSPGNYKFMVRYSSALPHTLQLSIDGAAQPSVTVPSTGDMNTFNQICLATNALTFGEHTFRLNFIDGGVDVDWLFVKKYDPMMSFKSALNGCYLTAVSGGNGALAATNNTAAGNWENYSVDDLTGAGSVTNGDTINLQVYDGSYITAVSGGGGQIQAKQRTPGSNELWTVVKLNGGGALTAGDQVAFQTQNGHYATVESNGTVDATATTIGSAQTFDLSSVGSQ
jgi:autotransporter-associated beta strand protein